MVQYKGYSAAIKTASHVYAVPKQSEFEKVKAYIKPLADYHKSRWELCPKILVLEDELTIRSFIVLNLKRAGFYVIEATTGEEALQILSEQTVDIALLDVTGD